jgi:hypothetical protein
LLLAAGRPGIRGKSKLTSKPEASGYEVVLLSITPRRFRSHHRTGDSSDTCSTKLIIAKRSADSGQKVENLREGVLHADKRSEVFVFVDSDVKLTATWLRDLVAPLKDPVPVLPQVIAGSYQSGRHLRLNYAPLECVDRLGPRPKHLIELLLGRFDGYSTRDL